MQKWQPVTGWLLPWVQVYDNPVLGMWAWKMRKDHRNNKLAQWKVDKLDSLEFLWKVDQVTSKWHTNLHDCRRYKVGFLQWATSFRGSASQHQRVCPNVHSIHFLSRWHGEGSLGSQLSREQHMPSPSEVVPSTLKPSS